MTNFNPHTATQQELRDWLAEQDGWVKSRGPTASIEGCWPYWKHPDGRQLFFRDPYPPTLAGAAAALPGTWDWTLRNSELVGTKVWKAHDKMDPSVRAAWTFTGDEITDRYRLACLARVAMKEAAK